ncbi:dipeptidyl-peptidase-4 [Granulicella rosea]|uniref:Dipeptidyl-peptidase-4 n=1 Tax=Granulicella rosea TaxID=474952 RepID=A0A239KNH1_9BACT|nr:prolyl oligopeptidase family serine peptidase [Granulicella rosea]SNT19580.1 dipeptidyl-peptidase-4 [Granulicella rosea]
MSLKLTYRSLLHLTGCFALALTVPVTAQTAPAKKLTIDRLYSLPWLIGTRPEQPVWSPDSKRVAFLWDDDGTNFHDIWVTDVTDGKPVRVTKLPRLPMPADAGTDVAKLEQVAKAESDHGVSILKWMDADRLMFVFRGEVYEALVLPGMEFEEKPKKWSMGSANVTDADVRPGGYTIHCVAGGELWGIDTGGELAPHQIYASGKKDVGVEQFRLSSDNGEIAFVEADATRIPVRGIPDYLGDESKLTQVKRAIPGEPAAGRRIGFTSWDGKNLRWAELGGDAQDLITSFAWSPDGKTLLVDKSDLYTKHRQLLLVNSATGAAKELLREDDPKTVYPEWWSDWAPDGKGVYFTSERGGDYHVFYQSLAGGEPKAITSGKWEVASATVSAKALFLVTNQGKVEERQVFRTALTGGAPERLTTAPGTHTPVASPDGRWLADVFSSDSVPPDLYLVPGTPGVARQVTHSALPEFADYHWVTASYVDFPSGKDGVNLHARLTLPPNFDPKKKYPAILGSVYSNTVRNQWGGRIAHPTWGLDQYLAQQGYVILNVDVAGSTGYGKAFRERIFEDYGGVDVEDLASGVKYLVAQGYVDERRVGIWGSSYGGLLTTMSLFAKPGLYAAGVAGAPATSLYHALTGEMRVMMAPGDHPAEYAKSSSFLRSGALEDHLMIIHGMRDQVVMFKDSVTLEQRLIEQGKDVDLVALPGAPHPWDTEGFAQTRYAYRKLADFFARYLGEPVK